MTDCPCSHTPGPIPRPENIRRGDGEVTCVACGQNWKTATPEEVEAVNRLIKGFIDKGIIWETWNR